MEEICAHQVGMVDSTDLWHARLGHPSASVVRKVSSLINYVPSSQLENKACDACLRAKQTRAAFDLNSARAIECFEMIHCDIWNPYQYSSSCGARYFLTIVDDHSRAVWIHLLLNKGEVGTILKHFFAMTKRQINKEVRVVRSDNGKEFIALKNYFNEHGIVFQTSCVYTPQQNGRVERKHRHILEVARALRFHANLPIHFWGKCVLAAGYLINRLPCCLLNYKSPYEILYNKTPCYTNLRVFRCMCYAHNKNVLGDKFAPRGVKCVFLGYSYSQKGWKVFDLENQKHFVSRDVRFFENQFPFGSTLPCNVNEQDGDREAHTDGAPSTHIQEWPRLGDDKDIHADEGGTITSHDTGSTRASPPHASFDDSALLDSREAQSTGMSGDHTSTAVGDVGPTPISTALRRSKRTRGVPAWQHDYEIQLNTVKMVTAPSQLPTTIVSSAISANREPQTYKEAVLSPHWREAMQREIVALERNGTWEVEQLPPDKRAIFCSWN
ncbi:unnamed protein product [Cuscuta europaea]|uniref:Integrase catalytic domain-containing protein n=1 Tax=Cuscuta europaea TaxID=41803 RepID=A0A9P1EL89_CUSEU|nr:unnamed protein product [Cuscuta europaea]